MRHLFLSAGLCAGLMCASLVAAQPAREKTHFDVYFAGLKAGEMTLELYRDSGQYAATGHIKSSGLVGALSKFRFKAETKGYLRGGKYQPSQYRETSDTGRRKSDRVIRYRGMVPRLDSKEKPKAYWLDPRSQKGAPDPLTVVWQLLQDRDADDLCKLNESFFDGARRVRLSTTSPKRSGTQVICRGTYLREGGFSRKEMREGAQFPFTLTYEKRDSARYKVARLDVKTLRGRALLIQR